MEVYDASGRMIQTREHQILPPGEHNISVPVERWIQGLYLLKIGIGDQYVVKDLLVQ